jgi:small subunit ribosomal protein S21
LSVKKNIITFAAQIKGGVEDMIIVPIKEGENIERALKKFKRKFEKTGTIREMRSRKTFVKKSVKRRDEVKKAIYVQSLRLNEE